MEMTTADYHERLERIDNGSADDEDRRLVKHYEREGYERPADGSWLFEDTQGEQRVRGENYGALSRTRLVKLAKDRKLSASGSQEELIARLREHDAAQAEEAGKTDGDTTE